MILEANERAYCFADYLGIRRICLAAFGIRLHLVGGHQTNIVTELSQRTTPVV
jgi:hypothetical protein